MRSHLQWQIGVTVLVMFTGLASMATQSLADDTVFFVVRHAEKAGSSGDVPLSDAGIRRSQQLMQALEHLNVNAIYHTDTLRAKSTAEPLATKLGISPIVYDDPSQQFLDGVASAQQGKRVLIVGHANTVGEIVGHLIDREVPAIGEQFDNLFIVVIAGTDKSMVRLHYGDPN